MDANDANELQSIITALQNLATTRYVSAAGLVLLLYDHLLTLPDEVEHVWSAPNTLGKVLFLILRYMVPIFMLAENITRSGLPIIVMSDVEQVLPVFPEVAPLIVSFADARTYAGWLSIAISNFLVLLRIWTTLPRGHRLIAWSLAFFTFMQLASFAVTTWVVSNMIRVYSISRLSSLFSSTFFLSAVLVFEPTVGVCTFTTKPSVFGLWVIGLTFEVVVFVTVIWNALDRPRALTTASNEQMRQLLFRDGVVYFLILFVLRVANTIIAVVAPISQVFVIVFFIWSTTTLTTSRLIINSRRHAAKARRTQEEEFQVVEDSEFAPEDTGHMRLTRSGAFASVG
ncbi:hypothetical protein B0H13DRAFT_2350358 [Mycena leptocephala]|nr:hypothetical protein B0H13DRAFT_2350358 [Mycena leptocephala]